MVAEGLDREFEEVTHQFSEIQAMIKFSNCLQA